MKIETLAVHAGHHTDPSTRAVSPSINLSTTFARDCGGNHAGYIYSRANNPNREDLESCLSILEGGGGAAAFSSGMAAVMAVFQSLARGDHVIVPHDVYRGTVHLLKSFLTAWGLQITFTD